MEASSLTVTETPTWPLRTAQIFLARMSQPSLVSHEPSEGSCIEKAQHPDQKGNELTQNLRCKSTFDLVFDSRPRTMSTATATSQYMAVVEPRVSSADKLDTLLDKYASTYRKIFGVIFTITLAVFIALVAVSRGYPDSRSVITAVSANLLCSILFRQEDFVNLCYELFTLAPHSWPLSVRKRLAKVYHYGGCHSGAGTAAVVWYLLYTALATRNYMSDPQADVLVNMVASWVLVTMFVIILPAAHPSIRRRFHDRFEMSHRFAGWTALATFWVQNMFAAQITARQWDRGMGYVLVHSPNFWFIIVTTCCSFLSWSRLRLRPVYAEKLSGHATQQHFRYRAMKPFYGVKLSDRPLTEWHAFATIPDTADAGSGAVTGFSVVVSNAGDWTKKQIESAAADRKLWIRGAPLHGVLYTSRLFKQIVVVATGSGIGPCLSLLFAGETPVRVH